MEIYYKGIVDWFGSGGQSYGYIKYDDGKQVYVHYKQIRSKGQRDSKFMELREGDEVTFCLAPGYRNPGTQASNVEITKLGNDTVK
tara:strand:- start:678 stop:935 length:258 start_codon:yes stop_codon:yes gene_type:complete